MLILIIRCEDALLALFQPITETDAKIGELVETAVYAQWIPRANTNISYANWRLSKTEQGEVDIVGMDMGIVKPIWAVEIKWTDRFAQKPEDLNSLLFYMEHNKLTQAIVTSKTVFAKQSMRCGDVHFVPTACYAYTVGKNTIYKTKQLYGL